MKIYDISRDIMTTPAYPGDPEPVLELVSDMGLGDVCNTSKLSLCLHNGTHLDAPLHFFEEGEDVVNIPLESCVGECIVIEFSGTLLGADAEKMISNVPERLLFKGDMDISPSGAFVLADAGLKLVGVEASSVAPPEFTRQVHVELLANNVLILENLDLSEVKPGRYMLFAQPLKISGGEASPVRAVLLERQI